MSEMTVGCIRTTVNPTSGIYEALLEKAERENAELADRLSGLELRSTQELAKLERERDEAREEAKRLEAICVSVHDRLLRGDDDSDLLKMLEEAWQKAARHKEAAK